jgi:hypothetical protein
VAGELRVAGGIAQDCPVCGAGSVVPTTASEWQCHACGGVTGYRWCPRCDKVLQVGPEVTGPSVKRWRCPDCRRDAKRDHWPAATISEYGAKSPAEWALVHYGKSVGEAISDPDRRRIDGSILEMTGISGMANGGCTVFFDRESAVLLIGDSSHRRRLSYSEITSLQIGGRGDVVTTTTSGTRWMGGGFGPAGIIEGVALSKILTALSTTTTKQHHIETIFHLTWTSGSMTLLNTKMLPRQWDSRLAPVFRRIEESRQQPPLTAHAQDKQSGLCDRSDEARPQGKRQRARMELEAEAEAAEAEALAAEARARAIRLRLEAAAKGRPAPQGKGAHQGGSSPHRSA